MLQTLPYATPEHKPAPILPIFLIVLVDIFGMTLIIPLLAFYAEHFYATPFQATLLVSVYAACMLISGPLLGRISDRIGRKPMLLVSQLGTFVGFLIMARATSLWMLYLARIIDGSTAGNISLAQAYISDNTEPKRRAKTFALIGIAFGVGFSVGPALSGWLTYRFHALNAPIYLAAAMSATSILCTALLLRSGVSPRARAEHDAGPGGGTAPGGKRLAIVDWGAYVKHFQRPALCGLLLQFLCFIVAFSLFMNSFALFAERRFSWHGHPFGAREVGYFLAYCGVLGVMVQGRLIGPLVSRFGERKLVVAGFLATAVAFVILGWAYTIPILIVSATISSFGTGVLRPVLTSLITQNAGRGEQGEVLGLTQSLSSVAMIVAPAVGGKLIEHYHLHSWACTAAAAATVGLVLAVRTHAAESHHLERLAAAAAAPPPGEAESG